VRGFILKVGETDGACSTHGSDENAYQKVSKSGYLKRKSLQFSLLAREPFRAGGRVCCDHDILPFHNLSDRVSVEFSIII
jgi:hypothetical protein